MKNSRISKKLVHLAIVTLTLFALAAFPMLSGARSAPVPFATSVNIVNNGSKSIRHVYVSHVNADDWSADLISGQAISPGQSLTLNNLSCDQQQAKVGIHVMKVCPAANLQADHQSAQEKDKQSCPDQQQS